MIDLDELAAAVAGPQTGDRVWSWHDDEVMIYRGPDDHGSQHVVIIGGPDDSGVKCPPGRVAPADIDVTSDRWDHLFVVQKGRGPSWLGNWALGLTGGHVPTWHKTKKDAIAAGRRRMAIVNWWAEHGTTDYAQQGEQG